MYNIMATHNKITQNYSNKIILKYIYWAEDSSPKYA